MENDEQIVEETTISPSEETKTTEETVETPAPVEEKKVPYDRFKEVVEERNKYKELLNTVKPEIEKTIQPQVTNDFQDEVDVTKMVKPIIDQTVKKGMDQITRQLELDRTIAQNPDFFKYADAIKAKIQENPYLEWNDAYKLAKFDSVQSEAREQGKIEATQKIQEKRKAVVETASKAKATRPSGGLEEINPLARGSDGKFLYTAKELEDVLPKS